MPLLRPLLLILSVWFLLCLTMSTLPAQGVLVPLDNEVVEPTPRPTRSPFPDLPASSPAPRATEQAVDSSKTVGRATFEALPSTETADNAALFVGISQFDERANLSNLRYAADDAVALCHLFVAELKLIPANRARLALGGRPQTSKGNDYLSRLRTMGVREIEPEKIPLEDAIEEIAYSVTSPESMVVYTFSSHGYEEDGTAYIMPANARRTRLASTGISLETVKSIVKDSKAGKRLLIVDACRERPEGETRGDSAMTSALKTALAGSQGMAVLASCGIGELSWENSDLGQGVFTHFLIESLRGAADPDARGFVTIGSVINHATASTADWVRINRGATQNPWFEGEAKAYQIPLAVSPQAKEAFKGNQQRREAALLMLRDSIGGPITGSLYDEIKEALEQPTITDQMLELIREIEALDGSERSKRMLSDYFTLRRDKFLPQAVAAARPNPTKNPPAPVTPTPSDLGLDALLALQEKAQEEWTKLQRLDGMNHIDAKTKAEYYVKYLENFGQSGYQLAEARERREYWTNWRPATPTPRPSPTPAPPSISRPGTQAGDREELRLPDDVKMAFRWCPAGSFTMGSPSSEAYRLSDEKQVQVRLTKGFWMAETEVTQAQYRAVMGSNPASFKGDSLPVENVSWNDATEFCLKLSSSSGLTISLPTEAQWEYACRAGTATPFHFGNTITSDQVNYLGRDQYFGKGKGEHREQTTPVGSFPANDWGLRDMHGNVCEWCADWYESSPPGGTDPMGSNRGPRGSNRVARGGAWSYSGGDCRSAKRYCSMPSNRDVAIGFRPVLLVQ